MTEKYTAEDLLKDTFEPKRQFRFILSLGKDCYLRDFQVESLVFEKGALTATFFETTVQDVFGYLYQCINEERVVTPDAAFKVLSPVGEVKTNIPMRNLRVQNFEPLHFDYRNNEPVKYKVKFAYEPKQK